MSSGRQSPPALDASCVTLHAVATYLDSKRAGARPRATRTNPHTQLDQNAPPALQEKLFARARALSGVVVGASLVSVPGARAFHLPACARPVPGGFMIEREFAHLHPASDGSLHMALPAAIVDRVIENGWAERHPLAGQYGLPTNIVMVYGPRDDNELEVVAALMAASHANACPADD
jgi:luciferase-like monooxygenase